MGKLEYNNEKSRLGIIENSPSDKLDIRGQQTAVEWFYDNLKNHEIQAEHFLIYNLAKEMEKDLALRFGIKCQMDFIRSNKITHVEEIYNETYGTHE